MNNHASFPRRTFLKGATATGLTLPMAIGGLHSAEPPKSPHKICAFIKFIQDLPYNNWLKPSQNLGLTVSRQRFVMAATSFPNVSRKISPG